LGGVYCILRETGEKKKRKRKRRKMWRRRRRGWKLCSELAVTRW